MPAAHRKENGWYEEDGEALFVYRHFAEAGVIPATDTQRERYRRLCELFGSFDRIRIPE